MFNHSMLNHLKANLLPWNLHYPLCPINFRLQKGGD